MAKKEHVEILKRGVEKWNKWRGEKPDIMPDLSFADLSNANLSNADLSNADLSNANLRQAYFINANLAGANLRSSYLLQANLKSADLSTANLVGANFGSSVLNGANLNKTNLAGAILWGADLREAIFTEADMRRVNLKVALMNGSNLKGANLVEAIIWKTDLSGIKLTEASFGHTILGNCDLSNIEGLDEVNHLAPSSIGADTLAQSKGQLPENFLRGCGLSDVEIECAKLHIPHLTHEQVTDITYKINELRTNQPIQFYSSFISYSAQDVDFAKKLYEDLQNKRIRCWFAPEDIKGGKKIRSQLDEAIRIYDKLILVLSKHSMNSSWVAHEIKQARKREKEKGLQMLFPIRLVDFNEIERWELFDDDDVSNLAAEVWSYFIPDFSEWKDGSKYQKAFDRLVLDLRAEKS